MKLYKLAHYRNTDEEHTGYTYRLTEEAAQKETKAVEAHTRIEIKVIEVPVSKAGILRALNVHGGHPDNG